MKQQQPECKDVPENVIFKNSIQVPESSRQLFEFLTEFLCWSISTIKLYEEFEGIENIINIF